MITCQEIVDRINSALDAEGFQQYIWDRDQKPAINYAVEFATASLDRILGKTRFVEDRLADLLYTGCWITNNASRFAFDEVVMGQKLWSVTAIYINPTTSPSTTIPQPNLTLSVFSPNHKYLKSYKSAWRTTVEEVSQSRLNPFAPGNELHALCSELAEWAYLSPSSYWSSGSVPTVREIEIVPDYLNKVLAMQYLKYPTMVTAITDNVEFPTSMTDMIVDKALAFITYKRGDGNLYAVSEADTNKLTNLLK